MVSGCSLLGTVDTITTTGITAAVSDTAGILLFLVILGISACLAGAVCGDHCSPISDTTIMSSAGAHCNHISHVETQLPYAISVAAISFVCYLLAGLFDLAGVTFLAIPIGIVLTIGFLFVMKRSRFGRR